MAFVHPAAVAPLARMRRVDGAALVAGSVGPDAVDYFVRMSARPVLHVEPAWLVASGVAGALALFACVVVAGPGVARALPSFLAARFGAALSRGVRERSLVHVVTSMFIGLLTHIVWDAFTERHGLAQLLAPGVVPWRALYLPTTVLGVVVLVVCVLAAPRVTSWTGVFDGRALAAVVTSSMMFTALFAGARHWLLDGTMRDAMAAASAGAIVGVVVAGTFLRPRRTASAPRA